MPPESGETLSFNVRGRQITINYLKQTHTAEITATGIGRDVGSDLKSYLQGYGVYTRPEDITPTGDSSVAVRLRPAAGIDIRDSSGTLVKRPVTAPCHSDADCSSITKQKSGYFRSKLSATIADRIGLEGVSYYTFSLSQADGSLYINASESTTPTRRTMKARGEVDGTKHNTVFLPSSLGKAAGLDGHGAYWEQSESGVSARTTKSLSTYEPDDENAETVSLMSVVQETPTGVSQTYRTYLRAAHAEKAAVSHGSQCLLQACSLPESDRLGLALIPESELYDGGVSRVLRTSGDNSQLKLTFPVQVVHALGLDSCESITWAPATESNALVAYSNSATMASTP